VSIKPLSAVNNGTTNDTDAAAADVDDDDYSVTGDDGSSDGSDEDFACSDSDDSDMKRNNKKAETKAGRGRGRVQKADRNKAAVRTKSIYCTADFSTCDYYFTSYIKSNLLFYLVLS